MPVLRPVLFVALSIAAAIAPPMLSAEDCRLCTATAADGKESEPQKHDALQVDIVSGLTFSRTAHIGNGGGQMSVHASGASNTRGSLINLGGFAVAGNAVVRGEPGRSIRIDMPASVEMTSSTGSKIEIINLQTDLTAAPHLDAAGQLSFSFGGELNVSGDLSGKFRGRIPITVQYE